MNPLILLIIILLVCGSGWGYSTGNHAPANIGTIIVVILIVLLLTRRI